MRTRSLLGVDMSGKRKPKPKRCSRCRYNKELRPCRVCYPEKVIAEIEKILGHELGQTVSYELEKDKWKL
jgi:hypothetical protein